MKRLLLLILILLALSNIVSAALVMGEAPEKEEIVVNEPRFDPVDFQDITGNAVAEKDNSKFDQVFFLITLCLIVLAAIVFLFQRVKPDGRR